MSDFKEWLDEYIEMIRKNFEIPFDELFLCKPTKTEMDDWAERHLSPMKTESDCKPKICKWCTHFNIALFFCREKFDGTQPENTCDDFNPIDCGCWEDADMEAPKGSIREISVDGKKFKTEPDEKPDGHYNGWSYAYGDDDE